MQIRQVTVKNFRGVRSFTWRPATSLSCIVGSGDSCKSTILDALELALGTRWAAFADVDFTDGDTSQPIEIVVTVGQLPQDALRENRMGMHLRGWGAEGLRDEPQGDDEPVVTVKLSVDASLEPAWELVTDRQDPRPLSPRDRALFGVVRLGGDAERHLTWGQGAALARLGGGEEEAAPALADAYRKARDLLKAGTLPALDGVAARVRDAAVKLGAYAGHGFSAGLDTQRSSMSLGSLALHGDGIPLRLSGLGTRRLVVLAIQQMAIPEGAIILIDEVEHGLEPHRIRYALKVLRDALANAAGAGQVILTTHASTTIVELSSDQLAICRRAAEGLLELKSPTMQLQALVRRVPEAFLSRRVLVCEGKTEIGLLRGFRDSWAARHKDEPLEARGVIMADGNGKQGVATACEFAALGYSVALLRDSDVELTPDECVQLQEQSVPTFEWEGGCSTEERILLDISEQAVQQVIDLAIQDRGEPSVLDSVRDVLKTKEQIGCEFAAWQVEGKGKLDLRQAIGKAAKNQGWFKRVDLGERLGVLVAAEVAANAASSCAKTLAATEAWAYG